ncbi:MAG: glycosyhydrolase [Fuerstiella sp.]
MYSEAAGSRKTLGDVDVVFHNGIYHLFHLVLPNHDFVAHAVSNNCLQWRRVENAIFIGHPGSWDDSMLWTVHVTPNPHRPGGWRMFYTGLSRRDTGAIQRIGMAESDDLYRWEKSDVNWIDQRSPLPYELPGRPDEPPFHFDSESCFPLEPDPSFYESKTDEGRHWISWRDPFYYREGDRGWLLAAGRVSSGPVVRRGCVAVMEEVAPNQFEGRPPLHHPKLYDDVEVPNLIRIDDEYYLIGSIREDAKIRYWHTKKIGTTWKSYPDNVLLGTGNYAGRTTQDERGHLLFSFYTEPGLDRVSKNLMPPPKRLQRHDDGTLRVVSYEGFDSLLDEQLEATPLQPVVKSSGQVHEVSGTHCRLQTECGWQAFVFPHDLSCFRLQATLQLESDGKCGLVFSFDPATRDGYYLSLDLQKGVAQLRAWGGTPEPSGERTMQFASLQAGYWRPAQPRMARLQLLRYGSYVELSVDGEVLLSLADQRYLKGRCGFYVESSMLDVSQMNLHRLERPLQSDEHLANG